MQLKQAEVKTQAMKNPSKEVKSIEMEVVRATRMFAGKDYKVYGREYRNTDVREQTM